MLYVLLKHFNSQGIYFDNNGRNYDYSSNVCNQQQPSRRKGKRRSKKKNKVNNGPDQQYEKEKDTEAKIDKSYKGYELMEKMGCENGKGLSRNDKIAESPMIANKTDRKDSARPEEITRLLSKSQRKRLRRRLRKQAKWAAQNFQAEEQSIVNDQNFLESVACCYRFKIEEMHKRLKSINLCESNDNSSESLIVAKIAIENQNVDKHMFEFIRNELVGWIGAYQKENMETPIFHSIANHGTHIYIVCNNVYAYNCLEQCIDDIIQTKSFGTLKLSRLPFVSPVIYCFDALYEGLARDPDLILTQLHLHKSRLYSNNWVVVSHVVCVEKCKTYFSFLIDEPSALALNFLYSRSFCICLQNITFRYRGIVNEQQLVKG